MNTRMSRFKQLKELSLSDIYIIFISLFILPFSALLLKIKGFKWTKAFLSRYIPKESHSASQSNQLIKAKNTARMVSIAANHGPYKANCLKKSLVTRWLLSRKGIQTELIIGVNRDEGDFNAHSWLEFQGVVLNDTADVDERYSVFDSYKSQKH